MNNQKKLPDFMQGDDSEWEEKTFSDVIEVNNYPSLEQGEVHTYVAMEHLHPYDRKIKGKEQKKYKYSAPRFKNRDTLFPKMSRCLELGKTAYVDILEEDEVAFGSTEFMVMRPKSEKVLPKFVYYTVRREDIRKHALSWATGSTARRQRISTDLYNNLTIRVPPKSEQKRIVSFLDAIDTKIEINNQISDILESITQELFKSWFVDFNPYTSFKDSEIGRIPTDWKIGKLGDIMEIKTDRVDPEALSPSTPYLSLKHMPEQSIILNKSGKADEVSSKKYRFDQGDILFGKLRPYFCKVGPAPVDGICSTDILVILPEDPIWKEYLIGQLTHQPFIDYCESVSTGTGLPRVSWEDMCDYQIAIPPNSEIENFHNKTQANIEQIIDGIHESEDLGELRDVLLPKLLSGEIRLDPTTDELAPHN